MRLFFKTKLMIPNESSSSRNRQKHIRPINPDRDKQKHCDQVTTAATISVARYLRIIVSPVKETPAHAERSSLPTIALESGCAAVAQAPDPRRGDDVSALLRRSPSLVCKERSITCRRNGVLGSGSTTCSWASPKALVEVVVRID